jgi:hypothetical protein
MIELDNLTVGAILVNTWGWEQTNVDFYEIVKRTKNAITVRETAKECDYDPQKMSGYATPRKGQYIGEPTRKMLNANTPRFGIKFEYGHSDLWDGEPKHYTDYA